MQLKNLRVAMSATAFAAAIMLNLGLPKVANSINPIPFLAVGLTSSNQLVTLPTSRGAQSRIIPIQGVTGQVISIDVRPANGLLYGLTDTNQIYTIDPRTGQAQLVSTLSVPFNGSVRSGSDFNPVPDRLRLVDEKGQNYRINVDTGVAAVDPNLSYLPDDINAGNLPQVTAAAYTNSFPGPASPARVTQLFDIDANRDVLVLQNPPNNGTLRTIGSLGVDFAPANSMDIFSPREGVNQAIAVSGSTFYEINLGTGAATPIRSAGQGIELIGVTTMFTPVGF
jgi:Domain of unknown function (DUF4394)